MGQKLTLPCLRRFSRIFELFGKHWAPYFFILIILVFNLIYLPYLTDVKPKLIDV